MFLFITPKDGISYKVKKGENLLAVSADNGKNDTVYPQKADFTFYGGIYRNVRMLIVPSAHFSLGYYGSPGIKVTPIVKGTSAEVKVEAWTEGNAKEVIFNIGEDSQKAEVSEGRAAAVFVINDVHLWNGTSDPFLYTVSARLDSGDFISTNFGCRTIGFDAERGFILNGEPYRLCGAARHQDRAEIGSALTIAEHDEDMAENHRLLNGLCHCLDFTRPTTMVHVFMLDHNDPFVTASDIRSYNLYYGWYVGDRNQNDEWFDSFHAAHPDTVIGLSEYGADANPEYQSGVPEKGDWNETYQALYHEHMLEMWSRRPYIWAMHCWNMFDFGADGRDEGGKPGQNQKGLVTFDRRTKKDAFYIYKAYLSDEPFVHLCGRRYVKRDEEETEVKVYSNQNTVTLFVDGKQFATKNGDKVFRFWIPISGQHKIEVRSGCLSDIISIEKVDKPEPSYRKDGGEIVNWFDREDEIVKEGFFSIKNSMEEVKAVPEAAAVMDELMAPLQAKAAEAYGDVAKNIEMPESVRRAMDKMSVEATLKQLGKLVTPQFVHRLNGALNKVPLKR